jgi:hypothetical protein
MSMLGAGRGRLSSQSDGAGTNCGVQANRTGWSFYVILHPFILGQCKAALHIPALTFRQNWWWHKLRGTGPVRTFDSRLKRRDSESAGAGDRGPQLLMITVLTIYMTSTFSVVPWIKDQPYSFLNSFAIAAHADAALLVRLGTRIYKHVPIKIIGSVVPAVHMRFKSAFSLDHGQGVPGVFRFVCG